MAEILLIEDSPTDTHAYSAVLRENGYDVKTASTGEEGIALAGEIKPDLILMDIVMPGVNGFQATRELQKSAETADIPVIMLSTKDQETDRIWGMRQGATDYLIKPVNRDVLINSIKTALSDI